MYCQVSQLLLVRIQSSAPCCSGSLSLPTAAQDLGTGLWIPGLQKVPEGSLVPSLSPHILLSGVQQLHMTQPLLLAEWLPLITQCE